jgi:hypothetical protein
MGAIANEKIDDQKDGGASSLRSCSHLQRVQPQIRQRRTNRRISSGRRGA